MIKAENLRFIYRDGTEALRVSSFQIEPGELVYVTGPSGSGKTSLMKLLMGVEYPTEGTLTVLGVPIRRSNAGRIQRLRRRLGPVFQEFRMMPGTTAMENVLFGMRFLGQPPKRMRADAADALEQVGLAHKMKSRVEHLSWGECQRVAIARAVARKPALILADEPTGNLDRENAEHILDLLASFRTRETTVIITTHATHLIGRHPGSTSLRLDGGGIALDKGGANA